jgi:glycosyltransferase involved in cell wall biosynthesis
MISIIIPTVNRPSSLVKLVESIRVQNFPADDFEVLIVYNHLRAKKKSTKNIILSELLVKIPNLKILVAPSKGVNHARNTGIVAAQGQILLFVDDDCIITDREYLNKINHLHLTNPQLVAIGGPYRLCSRASFWDRAYYKNMDFWLQGQRISLNESRALLGGNTAYKASIFSKGLRFTPGIKYGGSETPLNTAIFDAYGPLGFYEDLTLNHQSKMGARDFVYKAYMQGKGFALQSKLRPQQIQKIFSLDAEVPPLQRLALQFYSFFFTVGFRTSILERRHPLRSFVEESLIYLRKPLFNFWLSLRKGVSLAGVQREP